MNAAQRVVHGGGADRTGRAQRMAQRDGAGHRVDLGRIEAQIAYHSQRLRCECFALFTLFQLVPGDHGCGARRRNRRFKTNALISGTLRTANDKYIDNAMLIGLGNGMNKFNVPRTGCLAKFR